MGAGVVFATAVNYSGGESGDYARGGRDFSTFLGVIMWRPTRDTSGVDS